jgi:hypothetical protein
MNKQELPTDGEVSKMGDQELAALLEKIDCEVIDEVDEFVAIDHGSGGGQTKLEADNLSDALFETWMLYRPL